MRIIQTLTGLSCSCSSAGDIVSGIKVQLGRHTYPRSHTGCCIKPTSLLSLISEGFVRGRYLFLVGVWELTAWPTLVTALCQQSQDLLPLFATDLCSAIPPSASECVSPNQLPARCLSSENPKESWIHLVIVRFQVCYKSNEVVRLLFIPSNCQQWRIKLVPEKQIELWLWCIIWWHLFVLVWASWGEVYFQLWIGWQLLASARQQGQQMSDLIMLIWG